MRLIQKWLLKLQDREDNQAYKGMGSSIITNPNKAKKGKK
jgi:hypothetical protein